MTERTDVYRAIDTERTYQEDRWPGHRHSVAEYVLYMEQYLSDVRDLLSKNDDEAIRPRALAGIRKVTTLGVACMEEHGAPPRENLG